MFSVYGRGPCDAKLTLETEPNNTESRAAQLFSPATPGRKLAEVHLSTYFVLGTAEKQSAKRASMSSSHRKIWHKVERPQESKASVCIWRGGLGNKNGRTRGSGADQKG